MTARTIAYREPRSHFADLLKTQYFVHTHRQYLFLKTRNTYLVFFLVFVEFGFWIFHGFLFQFLRQLFHGKPRKPAKHELLQRVVNKFVLILVFHTRVLNNIKIDWSLQNQHAKCTKIILWNYQSLNHSFSRLSERFQVTEHVVTVFFFGQLQIGVYRQVNTGPTAAVTENNNNFIGFVYLISSRSKVRGIDDQCDLTCNGPRWDCRVAACYPLQLSFFFWTPI